MYLRELARMPAFAPCSARRSSSFATIRAWEGGVVEAPWIWAHDGAFYMFYSGNVTTPATAPASPARPSSRPVHEAPANPILRNDATWSAPSRSVVAVVAKHYFVYHAWAEQRRRRHDTTKGARSRRRDRGGADGWPKINDGTPSETSQVWPGEPR